MNKTNAPLYFIDDNLCGKKWNTLGKYGWNFENTAGKNLPNEPVAIHSIKHIGISELSREFDKQTDCTLTLETNLTFNTSDDGFSAMLCLGRDKKNKAMHLETYDGYICMHVRGKRINTGLSFAQGDMALKIICDLEKCKNTLYINGKLIGTYDSCDDDCHSADCLIFCNSPTKLTYVTVKKTALYTGYYLNEMFISSLEGTNLPDNWKFETDGNSTAVIENQKSSAYDPYGADLIMKKGTTNKLSVGFERTNSKVCFEMRFYMDKYVDGTRFGFCGDSEIYVVTNSGAYYTSSGQFLRKYNCNVWQTVRIEVNPDLGMAVYSINDKKYASEKTNGTYFDKATVSCSPCENVKMRVDDFFVFNMFDDAPDYVPTPKPVHSGDYNIGAEVCDIWRNGFQFGWDYTSGFEDLDSYLGKFDEGLTEPADWEIKWMVEHGIDFRLVCWYGCQPSSPQKMPRNTWGQKAYMNAKYTNMLKYAIQWEDTYNMPTCSADFRNYVVPYWVEYYLSDDRYFTIDNKPLICVFRTPTLLQAFGSEEGVKAEFDYLREVCRGLGYDGAIILCCSVRNGEECKRMGIDGVYGYNWGPSSRNPEVQMRALNTYCGNDNYITVPTVGVGFNTISLYDNNRSDLITPDDYKKLLSWVKNEYLPNRDVKEDWLRHTVILSNWNEFGEGHFIMPSRLHGFEYVDAVRSVFVSDTEHIDSAPDSIERKRFNSLYNQNMRRMRRLGYEQEKMDCSKFEPKLVFDFGDNEVRDTWEFSPTVKNPSKENGSMSGTCDGNNYWINSKLKLDINADEIDFFIISIKYKCASRTSADGKLFFITDSETDWNEDKCVRFSADSGDTSGKVYGSFSHCQKWHGHIIGLRLDPMKAPSEFEIKGIIFGNVHGITVFAGENKMRSCFEFRPRVTDNGDLEIVLNPLNSMIAYLGAYAEWRHSEGIYILRNGHHELIYTIGSVTAKIDGNITDLGYAPTLRDGLIQLHLNDFRLLGYRVTNQDNEYFVE